MHSRASNFDWALIHGEARALARHQSWRDRAILSGGGCRMSIVRWLCLLSAAALSAQEPEWKKPAEGDFVARDFRFASGEVMPELRLHYRTIGKLVRDERGHAQNAVLILHG